MSLPNYLLIINAVEIHSFEDSQSILLVIKMM